MTLLHWVDYFAFSCFVVGSLGIGVYTGCTGGKQRTIGEFLMADRKLDVLSTSLSILVSFISGIIILGQTAEFYLYGGQDDFGKPIAFILGLFLAERLFVPWLYPMKIVSVYEYLELRFKSKAARITGATIGILSSVLYMGIALYAPATALQIVTGIQATVSIPVMACVCMVYTAMGGMRAVVWTDVFQFTVIMGALITIVIVVVSHFFYESIFSCHEIICYCLSPDVRTRKTLWGYLFGKSMIVLNNFGLTQASVQRFNAIKSLARSRMALWLVIPTILVMYFLITMAAHLAFSHFADMRCDPLSTGRAKNANHILTLYVADIFKYVPGTLGLFMAALYSGALSSVSSGLSACAAICWEDIFKSRLRTLSDYQGTLLNKILVVIFGVLATTVGIMCSVIPAHVNQISEAFFGAAGGPLMGMFMLGGLVVYSNWIGVISGGMTGFIYNLWLSLGTSFDPAMAKSKYQLTLPPTSGCEGHIAHTVINSTVASLTTPWPPLQGLSKFYEISFLWYPLLGLLVTMTVGTIVSLLTGPMKSEEVGDYLRMNAIRNICDFRWLCSQEISSLPSDEQEKIELNTVEDKATV